MRQPRKRSNDERIQTHHQAVSIYLTQHPCIDCGEDDILVLEFDHVRGEKKDGIYKLVRNGCSLATIIEEIKKCEVRCANCHMRKTRIQLGWTVRDSVPLMYFS